MKPNETKSIIKEEEEEERRKKKEEKGKRDKWNRKQKQKGK